ncbi:hypothetical protein Csp2054_12130 [Curtobacterium sp. 'Ferrero']|uniref:ATP-binding protein n=1 Tax=Curtobacterium sp. 'Ferrero' TaxID=2033654 RepID=UPI000BD1A4D9|nr:ATP-binding protein [Curtobacterium sp. 'Ferrero']PCN47407.1 hypothetical protein Csp2054_12130 [Curtobacterium sp. 'Ferrero']
MTLLVFLDEAPEFPRAVLDALRQPLESGRITVHRSAGTVAFPAHCQVVLAANPCPCGNAGVAHAQACECTPSTVRRYLARLSGPLLDRIDIRVPIPRVTNAAVRRADEGAPSTAAGRALVAEARDRMAARLAGTGWDTNAEVSGRWLREDGRAEPGATVDLDGALDRGTLTMRGWDRVMRLAWTLADLARAERPGVEHVREALALRSAL